MNSKQTRSRGSTLITSFHNLVAVVCALLILPGDVALWAIQQQPATSGQQPKTNNPPQSMASPQQAPGAQQQSAASQDTKLSNEQLDSLVAPIALYPDPLLAQTLVACTYPLEIVQLQQFLEKNKKLKDKALTDAVMKEDWDPSIQAMAPFPDVVKQLSDNIRWTNDLGNAFLAQQDEVMNAVQRMRAKAVEKGALKTTEQQKVETKVVENKTVVVVEPSKTEVVYVPSYNPVAVWGAPYYPYPAVAYPVYPAGGMLLSFGVGMAVGAAWGHGGWGWGCGWGGNNDININRNNTFVNNYNRRTNAAGAYGANGRWQHNPQHRGGAPYSNRATAQKYGGTARGANASQRQTAARQGQGQLGSRQSAGGSQFRNNGGSASSLNRGTGGGGGDRVGNRQVSTGSMGSRNSSAFSGSSSGRAASASSARGASSMGSRGGGFRGGGGRRR